MGKVPAERSRWALLLFESGIAMAGWASILSAVIIGIIFGAIESPRISRGTSELFQLLVIVFFAFGLALIVAGMFHHWFMRRNQT